MASKTIILAEFYFWTEFIIVPVNMNLDNTTVNGCRSGDHGSHTLKIKRLMWKKFGFLRVLKFNLHK